MKEQIVNHNISIADRIHWWSQNGSFNLQLYLRFCDIKRNEGL
jgi:hypothetical protein